jgi:cytochrome c
VKKTTLLFLLVAAIYSCNSGTETNNAEQPSATTTTPAADDHTSNPDYVAGVELIAKSDCLTCHKVEEKAIGPAYRDVANKYENTEANVSMLAEKIIKGGKGNWGEVPMTPHPALTEAEAKQMVKYILLLKK